MFTLTTEEQRKIKDYFEERVDKSSRDAMIAFLVGHPRYHTMNSWNQSTSYAHCIKLQRGLGLPIDVDDVKYDMIFCPVWTDHMGTLMSDFDTAHSHEWQVGINGRSDGYIVLYQGGVNHERPFCWSGRSIDQGEDFYEWDVESLIDRVNLVQDFDMLVSDIVMEFGAFCQNYDVVDETIMVPKTIQVLQEKP